MSTEAERAPLLPPSEQEQRPSSPSFKERTASFIASLTLLEVILAALAFVFFVLTVVGFTLFGTHEAKHNRGSNGGGSVTSTARATSTLHHIPRPTQTKPPTKDEDICLTPTCVGVAAVTLGGLDETVDPCDDFYLFSNGGWLNSHPVPEDAPMFGAAQDIGLRNKRIISSILNSPPSAIGKDPTDVALLELLQSFQASCLDEDQLDRAGLAPFTKIAQGVVDAWRGKGLGVQQGLAFQSEDAKEMMKATRKDRLTAALLALHSQGIDALFSFYPEGDVLKNASSILPYLVQSGLGLPSKDYYNDTDVMEVYTEIVRATVKSIYVDGEILPPLSAVLGWDKIAKQVVGFETSLAAISIDVVELDNPLTNFNPHNKTELAKLFPSVSFSDYFAGYSPRPSYPDPVVVTSPKYLGDLARLIEIEDDDTLEFYFVFKVAQALGDLLGPKQTIRKEQAWLKNYLAGIDEGVRPARGDVCLESLEKYFGFLIGRYYIEKAFTGDSKEYAEMIIEHTIQAFKDRLPALDWLDAKTRSIAEDKASAITHKIGYPTTPNTTDPASLTRWFSLNLPVNRTDYFGNVHRSMVADEKRKWAQMNKPRDHGLWDMIPSEVNAYYQPSTNEIVFPAGILQVPYFSKDWPEYQAFGAFGSVAGHELSHAFDKAGRLYDKEGRLTNWWTNTTSARFEKLSNCIVDQYAGYAVKDANGKEYHINSRFTLGEDMADAGGLSQSFKAWKDRFDADNAAENYLLPGLQHYTREQLFFVAYAQGWARNIKPGEAVRRIRVDPHSPTNFRVIGPLSNDLNFQAAFGCKAGSPMNNVHKCQVW